MTYDEKLSDTVSLSEILDCFLDENEKPSIIIQFIKDHEENISDILEYSELSGRIFFSDFIAKCSFDEASYILKLVKEHTSIREGICLTWQILQSNLPERIKNLFRPYLYIHLTPKNSEGHPYSVVGGSLMKSFDTVFTNAYRDVGWIADKINGIPDEMFERIYRNLDYSLWRQRILQADLFLLLEPKKQYLILKSLVFSREAINFKFFKQILNSRVDTNIKLMVYEILSTIISYESLVLSRFPLPDELIDIVLNSDSFAEARINLDLYGIDFFVGEFIFFLLCINKIEWLKEMCETEEDVVRRHFNICDLIDKIFENGSKTNEKF